MINAIIASKNIYVVKSILNKVNDNVKYKIVTSESEFKKIVSNKEIDIIFLDHSFGLNDSINRNSYNIVNISGTKISEDNLSNKLSLFKSDNILKSRARDSIKDKIKHELEHLGYNFKYHGTHYLIEAIQIIYDTNDELAHNLKQSVYPITAKNYNKTVHNIKVSISRATECMYCECNVEVLKKYFCFYDDSKPTAKQVIYTILNKI